MAEKKMKTPELPLSQSKQPNSTRKKKKTKKKNKGGQIAESPSGRPKEIASKALQQYLDILPNKNAELDKQWEEIQACQELRKAENPEPEGELLWVEPTLSESDVEREESLKEHVPELPIFVHFKQKCRKLRRIPTSGPGLFIYSGESCLYWPKLHEIPTKFPESMKKRLRASLEKGDEKNYQLMIDNYEERYKLWHIYGMFQMFAHDREDLEKSFNERLDELILENSIFYHFTGKKWGYGTFWKREMARSAKTQHSTEDDDRVLKGAKLWKKPLIRGKLKFDKTTRRTHYTGWWNEEEDSDFETCPSPPSHWT